MTETEELTRRALQESMDLRDQGHCDDWRRHLRRYRPGTPGPPSRPGGGPFGVRQRCRARLSRPSR